MNGLPSWRRSAGGWALATNEERRAAVEARLQPVPGHLARKRYRDVDARADAAVVIMLAKFRQSMIERYGGRESGTLVMNSCYRPAGKTCMNDTGGEIDLTDANGHWTGRSIDYSAKRTAWSFFGRACPKWRRDDVRDALAAAGFSHPWYYTRSGNVYEYWHIGAEVEPWKQSRVTRGAVPHWYDGLRPESDCIRSY